MDDEGAGMMDEAFWWTALAVVVMFGWIGSWVIRDRLAKRDRMRLREMVHAERMAALERGMEVPEADADEVLMRSLERHSGSGGVMGGEAGSGRRGLRRAALGLGLVLLFGGVGYWVGLSGVPETPQTAGMTELASLGAIPALAGAGLLLYWLLLGRETD